MISAAALAAFKAHAASVYPAEACGLVTADGYLPCENRAAEPLIDFRIDEAVFAAAGDVLAVMHSHTHVRDADGALKPEPVDYPSVADQKAQPATGVVWGISVVVLDSSGEVHVADPFFFGDQVPIQDLIGRPFRHAVTDCYSLIRDWYRLEGVVLPNFPRENDWWGLGQNLYLDNFTSAGFRPVSPTEIQEGDVFLARVGSPVPAHGGVYVGGGLVLDHPRGKLSGRRPVSMFQRFGHQITHWLRHETR